MYVILVIGVILWLSYGIVKNDLPIILANIVTLIPTLVILFLKVGELIKPKI
jgi:MtN3 and saliva related transmembrane protein